MDDPVLVLASNSPRRRELLAVSGWNFEILPCEVDESLLPGEEPVEHVLRLAASKLRCCSDSPAVKKRIAEGQRMAIVAADTIVIDQGSILGKPKDAREAAGMLRQLRDHTHQVYTALAVELPTSREVTTDLCSTDVPMRNYSDAEIDAYVLSGDPLDKAGAYAIQNADFHPVELVSGCYASVMGMPLCHLARTLRQAEVLPVCEPAAVCRSYLNFNCQISRSVLDGRPSGGYHQVKP
jgi:septum formation protein